MKFILTLAILILSQSPAASEPQPIIDMHIHSYGKVSEYGTYGTTGPQGLQGSASQEAHFKETHDRFSKYNIVKAVASGSPESITAWKKWDTDSRIISGLMIDAPGDYGLDPAKFEEMVKSGMIEVYGELGPYYSGTKLSDPEWQPFLEICERYDIPVAVHTGGGSPGGTYGRHPNARLSLGDPFLIEDILVKYPKLRVYIMHAGEHQHEHALRLMEYYPQLYADISVLLWIRPLQRHARQFLLNAQEAGVLDRVMFGSDQMRWPDAIDLSIEYLESLEFLSDEEKRGIYYDNAARFLGLIKDY